MNGKSEPNKQIGLKLTELQLTKFEKYTIFHEFLRKNIIFGQEKATKIFSFILKINCPLFYTNSDIILNYIG